MNNNPNRPANANRRPPDPNGQGSRTNGAPERGSPPQRTRSPHPVRPPRPDPAQMSDEEYARYQAWLAQKRVRQAQAQAQAHSARHR